MIDFCSIAPHLQIRNIAEKIDFYDQIQFEMSSKHGKHTVRLQQHKPIVEVAEINVTRCYMCFYIKTPQGNRLVVWSQLCHLSDLPHFVVSKLEIHGDTPLENIIKICEKVHFVKNKTTFHFISRTSPNTVIFNKIVEDYNITRFYSYCALDADFVSLPAFEKLDAVDMNIDAIPAEMLLQMKFRRLNLKQEFRFQPVVPVVNLFFEEWFHKKRKIDWFQIFIRSGDTETIDTESLFFRLPFSTIWKYGNTKSLFKVLDDSYGTDRFQHLCKKDAIYTIERGDMNLLVFVREDLNCIRAKEYIKLSDVLQLMVEDSRDSVATKKARLDS